MDYFNLFQRWMKWKKSGMLSCLLWTKQRFSWIPQWPRKILKPCRRDSNTATGFICMGLIVVEPYKTDLYDHASRVLRLYLTLAIARVAPILTRIASYWEAYRNLLELLDSMLWNLWRVSRLWALLRFAKGGRLTAGAAQRDERFANGRRPYKQLAFLGLLKQRHFLWITHTLYRQIRLSLTFLFSTYLSTLGILEGICSDNQAN